MPIQTQPTFNAGNPRNFIKDTADSSGARPAPSLIVVQNWLEELKRLVPVN